MSKVSLGPPKSVCTIPTIKKTQAINVTCLHACVAFPPPPYSFGDACLKVVVVKT